jgi:hypothetical protein
VLGPTGFESYCIGNVLKYTWRARLKDSPKQNLAKAEWYAAWVAGRDPRE